MAYFQPTFLGVANFHRIRYSILLGLGALHLIVCLDIACPSTPEANFHHNLIGYVFRSSMNCRA
jgi:hypothetical protein